jgi:SulP family sulfate permease
MADWPGLAHVCLFAQPINRVDVTGVETFARLRALVQRHGCTLHISGLKLPVEQALERAGMLAAGPQLRTYRTDAETLQALQQIGTTMPVETA